MVNYGLFNMTGDLVNKPIKLCDIPARSFDDAFMRGKAYLCKGIRAQLHLSTEDKISFTELFSDDSLPYGKNVRYTTCCVTKTNGDTEIFDYAIKCP